jgi:phosphoserine phosphatase
MSIRKLTVALALGAISLVPIVASAETPMKDDCILREHRVTSVKPYQVLERQGRGSVYRLAGAEVFVRAEPGLTAEWLQLTIERHLAQMQAGHMAGCALDLDGVRVQVDSAGPGFAVKIIAKNPSQAKEVLRRAQLLQH